MPVQNDADTGTVYTIGRPRPTLTIETYAFVTSGVATATTALLMMRYGAWRLASIAFLASLATFVLLAYDIGRKSGKRKSAKSRSAPMPAPSITPDFSAYEFGPFIKLPAKESDPLPPDFGPECMLVFYAPDGITLETWITDVPNAATLVLYVEDPVTDHKAILAS